MAGLFGWLASRLDSMEVSGLDSMDVTGANEDIQQLVKERDGTFRTTPYEPGVATSTVPAIIPL
jgi:hypothetical protein